MQTDLLTHFYEDGQCKWTGCEAHCLDLATFLRHISSEHTLDDKSAAQIHIQMQVVSQLELHLQKERDKLQAMVEYLGLLQKVNLEKKLVLLFKWEKKNACVSRNPTQSRHFYAPSRTFAEV